MNRYVVELEAGEREHGGAESDQRAGSTATRAGSTTGARPASTLRISARRVDRVKKRFVEDGLEAALGSRQGRRAKYLPRPGSSTQLRGSAVMRLRLLRWNSATASRTKRRVFPQTVARIGWVTQRNAEFAARVLDVYRRPYDPTWTRRRQLIGETRMPVPPAPGRPARGTTNTDAGTCTGATEPLAGRRLTKVTERRTKTDWARFLHASPGARRRAHHDGQPQHAPPRRAYETFEPARAKAL